MHVCYLLHILQLHLYVLYIFVKESYFPINWQQCCFLSNKMNFPAVLGIFFDPFLEAGYLGVDPLVMDQSK